MIRLFWIGVIFCLFACEDDKSLDKVKPYQGAMIQSYNIETLYSDSAKLKMKMKAPKQLQYQSGDLEYPEGIEVLFYNHQKQENTRLTALKGYYNKQQNLYTATGKVVVKDLLENKTLKTEELHWLPNQRKIYTDKFVVIESGQNIIKGEGFTANQDFKYYKILKPTGSGIMKKKEPK